MANEPILIFDCQTSGTNPKTSFVIEAGWGMYHPAENPEDVMWTTHLVSLPNQAYIPSRVQKITGIGSDMVNEGHEKLSYQDLCQRFFDYRSQHINLPLVIHYAQFERAFLSKMAEPLGQSPRFYDANIICTHKLSKLVCPGLNSYTLRALSGFFGFSAGEKKRTKDHLIASAYIWRGLMSSLDAQKPSFADLRAYQVKPGRQVSRCSDELRERRLALSEEPGVYHFLDHSGRILYVGKAKRLKHRVNSYFRGRKSKGSHLNEMLTRVSDFKTYSCSSHLEALIKESDDIKAYEPPYNRLLRAEGRQISFMALDQLLPHVKDAPNIDIGPLASSWSFRFLDDLLAFLQVDEPSYDMMIWGHTISQDLAKDAIHILFDRYKLSNGSWLALGFRIWFRYRRELLHRNMTACFNTEDNNPHEKDEELDEASLAEPLEELTVEALAELIESMVKHSYLSVYRSRWLRLLTNASCQWTTGESLHGDKVASDDLKAFDVTIKDSVVEFVYTQAKYTIKPAKKILGHPKIDVAAFDRLSIVYKELRRSAIARQKVWLRLPGKGPMSEADLLRLLF